MNEVEFSLVGLLVLEVVGSHHAALEVVEVVVVDITTITLHRRVANVALDVSEIALKDLGNRLVAEGLVSVLRDVGVLNERTDVGDVIVEGLGEVALIDVLHPANGELVAETSIVIDAVDNGVVAVGGPGGLHVGSGGDGVDAAVSSEVLPHGARVAGLHVVDDLLEHLLLPHGLEGLHELVGVEIGLGEADDVGTAVIEESEENSILLSGLEDLAASALVAGEDLEVVLGGDGVALVVDHVVLVVVDGIIAGFVEEGVGDGVLGRVGDVILGEHDDVLGLVAVLDEDMVSVGVIGLVSVIGETFGAGDEDGPLLGGGQAQEGKDENKELHRLIDRKKRNRKQQREKREYCHNDAHRETRMRLGRKSVF